MMMARWDLEEDRQTDRDERGRERERGGTTKEPEKIQSQILGSRL
jgi:hypothetical protein